jgi:hypothetical protein
MILNKHLIMLQNVLLVCINEYIPGLCNLEWKVNYVNMQWYSNVIVYNLP